MPSCVFNTCCGCIELRTGCLVIGYLNLIGEILFIAFGIVSLVSGGVMAANGKDEETKDIGVAFMAVSIILLLVLFFLLAFTIVLLVGIHKNKRGHVKAYLIVSVICLVLSVITTLAGFAGYFDGKTVASRIISYILSVYFLMVIRSYYYKMDDKRPAIYNTA